MSHQSVGGSFGKVRQTIQDWLLNYFLIYILLDSMGNVIFNDRGVNIF